MRSFGDLSKTIRVPVLVYHQNKIRDVFEIQILLFLILPVIASATFLQESLSSAKPVCFVVGGRLSHIHRLKFALVEVSIAVKKNMTKCSLMRKIFILLTVQHKGPSLMGDKTETL